MKAQCNITQIARLLGHDKFTISCELRCKAGCRGYRAKQACELVCKRSEFSRSASTLTPCNKEQASELLQLKTSPEQIVGKLPASHESFYLHLYADLVHGGTFWKNLPCQKQKRERCASGRDHRGQIANRRMLREPSVDADKRLQVGHWECDTVIGALHKQAIVTVVEHKSRYAAFTKVLNKTSDLVGSAIIEALKPFKARDKMLTHDNDRDYSGHAKIDKALCNRGYFTRHFVRWARGSNENFNGLLQQYVPKKRPMARITDEKIKMIEKIITVYAKDWDAACLQGYLIYLKSILQFLLESAVYKIKKSIFNLPKLI